MIETPRLEDFQIGSDESFWEAMFDDENDWIMSAY
jgi:hypothetical protein